MKKQILLIFAIVFSFSIQAQVISWDEFYNNRNQQPILQDADFITPPLKKYSSNGGDKKNDVLPYTVDNSTLPFFRPIFDQGHYSSCQQASGILSGFAYEVNLSRGINGADTANFYPAMFTYNLMHDGNAWNGISMFSSFNIVKYLGHPTQSVYPENEESLGTIWLSGYDKWYEAMHNRIDEVYSINISTAEGLEQLKGWLYNHNGQSEYGGVAIFNSQSPWNSVELLPETPEAGKKVITAWSGKATHGMVIVGYNDSIRYDYNNDGRFTTNVDLNDDGIIDLRDSEMGAYKFANSYGIDWADEGFCYAMYKAMADPYPYGGVWNNEAVIISVKENYQPQLTARYTISSTSREKLRFTVGISTDENMSHPEYILDLPCFRYQGGNNYMQGFDEEEAKTMEGAFDLAPFIPYIDENSVVKFYFVVNSNDILEENIGEIIDFEIYDYVNNKQYLSPNSHVTINSNLISMASVECDYISNNPKISNEPYINISQHNELQLMSNGGEAPYNYSFHPEYVMTLSSHEFPPLAGEAIHVRDTVIELPFNFPFYGKYHSQITIDPAGFLMFGENYHPWPYCVVPAQAFRQSRMIAAFLAPWYNDNDYEIYIDATTESVTVFWVNDAYFEAYNFTIRAAARLYKDGKIELFNNSDPMPDEAAVVSGISDGNIYSYTNVKLQSGQCSQFTPLPFPQTVSLSALGLLQIDTANASQIYEIPVVVTDKNGQWSKKTFVAAAGMGVVASIYTEGYNQLVAGTDAQADLVIFPTGEKKDATISLQSTSPFITINNPTQSISLPGDKPIEIEGLFDLTVDANAPNLSDVMFVLTLDTLVLQHYEEVLAPAIEVSGVTIFDGVNNEVEPGKALFMEVTVSNQGNISTSEGTLIVTCTNPNITIHSPEVEIDIITPGEYQTKTVALSVSSETPIGEKVSVHLEYQFNNTATLEYDYIFYAGKKDALVMNLSSVAASGDSLYKDLTAIGLNVDTTSIIIDDLNQYKAVFLSLGGMSLFHKLTEKEALIFIQYLGNNGKFYMEGTISWFFDDWTSLHTVFRVEKQTQNWYNIDSVYFKDNIYGYSMPPNRLPNCFENIWPATTKVTVNDGKKVVCYCNYQHRKTIASAILYGAIMDTSNQPRTEYARDMATFFELFPTEIQCNVLADIQVAPVNQQIQFITNVNREIQQIIWSFEGNPISTEHDNYASVYWEEAGTYDVTCTVTVADSLIEVVLPDYITIYDNSGIHEPAENRFISIYPNPATGVIYIHNSNQLQQAPYCKLYNLDGKCIFQKRLKSGNDNIDIRNIPAGLYLLEVQDQKDTFSQKILIY